jgi:hypothetical protein
MKHCNDKVNEIIDEGIRKNGFEVISVTGDDTHLPYAYTVGLTLKGLPELLIVEADLSLDDQCEALDCMAREFLKNDGYIEHLRSNKLITQLYIYDKFSFDISKCPVEEAGKYAVNVLNRYDRTKIEFLKLIWQGDF